MLGPAAAKARETSLWNPVLSVKRWLYGSKQLVCAPLKISVIIPAFNEESLLAGCLKSVNEACLAFAPLGWVSEVIVCDNNSTDRTAEIAREAGATVVFEAINQISRARNRGAAAAGGDWLVFVDADSYPSAELFGDLAHTIQSGKCFGGGANVVFDGRINGAKYWVGAWNLLSRTFRWAAGSFVFCERATFVELGGFSAELFASEEIEFSRRLKRLARRQGKRVVILRRYPLLTSSRKLRLYSAGELRRFFLRATLRPGKVLRDRDACALWYDGRR